MLFNYYINDLVIDIKKKTKLVYLYADDLALISRNETELRNHIKLIERWCTKLDMKLNYNKCGILQLGSINNKHYIE